MQNNTTDLLIVGAGPVGIFTAYQAGFLGMKTIIVDSLEEKGGQLTALYPYKYIYDIPAFPKILAKDLIANLIEQAQPFNPTYLMNTSVTSLDQTDGEYKFIVKTTQNHSIQCKAIIIAAGAGAFAPNKPPLPNIDLYESTGCIMYSVKDPKQFKDKVVVIAGGGDSAVDWAIELHNYAKKIYVVHRRNSFRAAEASVSQMKNLVENGNIELVIPYQLDSLVGSNNILQKVIVKTLKGEVKELEADILLALFGLARTLGDLERWGFTINHNNSSIDVKPASFETKIPGIFAVGDVAHYDHKIRLISVGFGEAALAVHSVWKYVFPDKVLNFTHSTAK